MDRSQVLFNCGWIITRHQMDTELKTIFPKLPEMKKNGTDGDIISESEPVQSSHLAKHIQWEGRIVASKKSQSRGRGFRGREADEVTIADPVQEDSDSKSESHVIEAFLTVGHNTKPLSCVKESERHQRKNKEERSWAGSDEEIKKPIAGDQYRTSCPGES